MLGGTLLHFMALLLHHMGNIGCVMGFEFFLLFVFGCFATFITAFLCSIVSPGERLILSVLNLIFRFFVSCPEVLMRQTVMKSCFMIIALYSQICSFSEHSIIHSSVRYPVDLAI